MKHWIGRAMIAVCMVVPSCSPRPAGDGVGADIIRKFTHYYFEYFAGDLSITYGTTFLGLVIMQHPVDMWTMQEIISEIKPDVIIETGTAGGGAALFYATVLKEVNSQGKVITIDIDPKPLTVGINKLIKDNPALYPRVKEIMDNYVEAITSNSVDPSLIERLQERTRNKKIIVTLDSCHNYEHVLREMNLYAPLVSPGSYLVVQDTYLDDKEEWVELYATCPGYSVKGGPRKALHEFLKTTRDFTVDKSRERFLFTFYPSGYLKKVMEQ